MKKVLVPGLVLWFAVAAVAKKDKRAGEKIFKKNCAECHYTSDRRKIGPGLKGLFRKGALEENGEPVTETNVRKLIENGAGAGEMPPFKGKIKGKKMQALLEYLRKL